jgi:hypothetical protein
MPINNSLVIGKKYTRAGLATILLQDAKIRNSREGIYYCSDSTSVIFFVDLEKGDKNKKFHFNDFFAKDFFHWDSQPTQHLETPTIKKIMTGKLLPHLFVRIEQMVQNTRQPFVYCGRLDPPKHKEGTSLPVHLVFKNIDYSRLTADKDLLAIYDWGATEIKKELEDSEKRKPTYTKPNKTERKGLITTRVGQGYYRQEIVKKWHGTCPITKCNITEILISSHIVSWSDSNDEEKLDVHNGILLSPDIDALFDKHLITFNHEGNIQFSDMLSEENRDNLGLLDTMHIPINAAMLNYLKRHQKKFEEKNKNFVPDNI